MMICFRSQTMSMSRLLVSLMWLQCVMMARMPSSSSIHDADDSAVKMVRGGVKALLSDDTRDKRRADKHLGVAPAAPSQLYSAHTTPSPSDLKTRP